MNIMTGTWIVMVLTWIVSHLYRVHESVSYEESSGITSALRKPTCKKIPEDVVSNKICCNRYDSEYYGILTS